MIMLLLLRWGGCLSQDHEHDQDQDQDYSSDNRLM